MQGDKKAIVFRWAIIFSITASNGYRGKRVRDEIRMRAVIHREAFGYGLLKGEREVWVSEAESKALIIDTCILLCFCTSANNNAWRTYLGSLGAVFVNVSIHVYM